MYLQGRGRHTGTDNSTLCVFSLIRDFRLKLQEGFALLQRLAYKLCRQTQLKFPGAFSICCACEIRNLTKGDIKCLYSELDAAGADRLAEEIVALDSAPHKLSGQIIGLVGRQHNFEFGQDIALHSDAFFDSFLLHKRHNAIFAEIDFIAQLKLSKRHAEIICLCALFENFVAAGIKNFKCKRLLRQGLAAGQAQSQRPHMDDLSRLIQGLVCRQKDLLGAPQCHTLTHFLLPISIMRLNN